MAGQNWAMDWNWAVNDESWQRKTLEQRLLGWEVFEKIEANPETWFQGQWAKRTQCGSAFCFGGHTVLMLGGTIIMAQHVGAVAAGCVMPGRVEVQSIADAATAGLGLDPADEAIYLFHGKNTLEDLRGMVRSYFGPRP